jgi:hypothetical protein
MWRLSHPLRTALGGFAFAVLAACSSSAGNTSQELSATQSTGSDAQHITSGSADTSNTAPNSESTSPSSADSSSTTDSSEIVVTDADAGQTRHVPLGGVLVVRLGSVYWQFQPASDSSVLALDGDAVASNGTDCPPGVGCGSATQRYRAVGAGTATVTAMRTSCGEALQCRPDQESFTITLIVD